MGLGVFVSKKHDFLEILFSFFFFFFFKCYLVNYKTKSTKLIFSWGGDVFRTFIYFFLKKNLYQDSKMMIKAYNYTKFY